MTPGRLNAAWEALGGCPDRLAWVPGVTAAGDHGGLMLGSLGSSGSQGPHAPTTCPAPVDSCDSGGLCWRP